MADQIYIGNFAKGQVTSRLPFNIDNDAFPTLYNFYSWRGRAKRKRGTVLLGRLQIQVISVAVPATPSQIGPFTLVADQVNIITALGLPATSSITPGTISFVVGANTYTEPAIPDGTLVGAPGGSGFINYATGLVTITGIGGATMTGTFSYFPGLPVMGLRDYVSPLSSSDFPLLLAFDTKYSYQFNQNLSPNFFYNTTFYKGTNTPFTWSGGDFQQFWTTNYSGALWATNNTPGFQFEVISTITVGSPTTITTGAPHGLITGDYVWFNEITGADAGLLNGQSFQITKTGANTFTVAVNTTGKVINNNGIFQTLTATSPTSAGDGIKWYDGDPTGGTGIPTGTANVGWVNFSPPLTAATVSINNLPPGTYYLVGALAILPFKDRLLFFKPWVQTSTGAPIQLQVQDVVIWSWNGTPYYTAPVPTNQTFDVSAYYVDQTGKGGWQSAGIAQPIATISNNEDALLVGFGGQGRKTRFVYRGDDLQPFAFYNINSQLPSTSTFSSIALDRGAIDMGTYGICMTDQQSSQRVDLDIPDNIFQVQALNNGKARVNAARDFQKEWIYFAYPVNTSTWRFPTQTFLFNYRDNTWAVFYENFTAHGNFRRQNKYTWKTLPFKTWNEWREPWNSGATSAEIPNIIAGNPQGYVLIKASGTGEAPSGTIQAVANNGGNTQITSIDHCVRINDYLFFQSALGITPFNGQIGKVIRVIDANNFIVDVLFPSGTYLGLGTFARLSQPLLQTKQFPVYWEQGRQVRLSVQKYLMDTTAQAQVTVNIYLSQNPDDAWNGGSIVPITAPNPTNNALIYSQLMYTCPESGNIGLTPANTNLQMPTASEQFQIWHRYSTSLIGDSFQIGITLSDQQMRVLDFATAEITLHGMQLTVSPGPLLS